MLHRFLLPLMAFAAVTSVCIADKAPPAYLRVAEITLDPPEKEQQVVSLRLTPGITRSYDKLRFECVYRQEYDWTGSSGRKQRRINEPVNFVYERDDVRLTDDLDSHISFKMPIGVELLRTRFGSTTFRQDVPVTVARIIVTAFAEGEPVWTYELPVTKGVQTLTAAHRTDLKTPTEAVKPKPRGERAAFGSIDLD